jgi:site-specific DNA-methyltransferase (adenine-specific)
MQLRHWDCLELMKNIPDGSIDCIITDPPYWTTACRWDTVIPFDLMWEQLKRIIKPNGAIVLFWSEPFNSALRMSNIKQYKYDWIWNKWKWWNPLLAKKQPMKSHEIVSVFYNKLPTYSPQMTEWKSYQIPKTWWSRTNRITNSKDNDNYIQNTDPTKRYPLTIQEYHIHCWSKLHPTQKPVALIEYLIKTYTNEWETVLDFTMWSGTTWVACVNTNRDFIGIEMDDKYFEIAKNRILK